MINDHIFPNLTTSPYNFDQTGDLSAVREGCEPGSRQLKGQASDQRVNRGLASNDHPGSFAGQWAGRSILPGDADQGRTATVSHLKEEVRIMGNDGLETSQY